MKYTTIYITAICFFVLLFSCTDEKYLLLESTQPTLVLSTNFIDKDISQSTSKIGITVEGSATWKATVLTGVEWFSIPIANQTGSGSDSIVLNFLSNDELAFREGKIEVVAFRGETKEPTCVSIIRVIQAGRAPFIKLVNTVGEALTQLNMSRMGGIASFRIVSNIDWKLSFVDVANPTLTTDWVTSIDPPTKHGSKSANVTISGTGNPSYDAVRTANVLVESVGITEVVQAKLLLNQATKIDAKSILIAGMIGYLKDGAAEIVLEPQPAGTALTIPVEINNEGGGTSILLLEPLALGNYLMKQINYTALSSVSLNGLVSIVANAENKNASENWDNGLKMFGGNSSARPLTVASAVELKMIADAVNAGNAYAGLYIQQSADISLADYANWTPIGNATNKFKGIYDGNNKSITNLTITSTVINTGLFGVVEGTVEKNAEIRNLSLYGSVTSTGAASGCFVGRAYENVIISHCTNFATFNFSGGQSGGIVGICANDVTINQNRKENILVEYCINKSVSGVVGVKNDNGGVVGFSYGTVRYCAHEGNIKSTLMRMGGLVGANYALVERCYVSGTVTIENVTTAYNSGGILGFGSQYSTLKDSYFCGDMSGLNENRAGALVGQYSNQNSGQTSIEIRNCYVAGTLPVNAGFVVGNNNGYGWNNALANGKITGIYHLEGVGITKNSGNEPLSTAQYLGISETLTASAMKLQASFAGWDFSTIWAIDATNSFPYLKDFIPTNLPK